jgi:hypothetical protein
MPRCGRLRTFIREFNESPRTDKISFIPPFFILIFEIFLIIHAIAIDDIYVIILTLTLLIISLIEIVFVSLEIHEHYVCSNLDRILTIKLDDFITEKKLTNVKRIVTDFLYIHPEYEANRNEVYHIACQVLETHKKEEVEKELTEKLTKFIKRRKKANVDDIIVSFLKKFPKYRKFRIDVYEKTCLIMGKFNEK